MAVAVIPGQAAGRILALDEGLSFWGGVDPASGCIIDTHHPQAGEVVTGRILMMPTSRGSCSGSGVLLDLILGGRGPAALVFGGAESTLTLGALVADRLFGRALPVLRLPPDAYAALAQAPEAAIAADTVTAGDLRLPLSPLPAAGLALEDRDRALLQGQGGRAARIAMDLIVTMAALQDAPGLIDVTRGHIDGCIHAAPAYLRFAETMRDMGARVAVPTTMNAISVTRALWQAQSTPPALGEPASRLADAYVAMGAAPTFTCAPYHVVAPARGEALGWSESNAVIYANSVLGARTEKHPDFLDLMVAVTGRAPRTAIYRHAGRVPRRILRFEAPADAGDALWPLAGWLAGQASPDRIPLLAGLEGVAASADDLRALCAAFGTTSGAPMLHVAGHTPEAGLPPHPGADTVALGRADLARAWEALNDAPDRIDLVAIGSPHASEGEVRRLLAALAGRRVAAHVALIVTVGPQVADALAADGTAAALAALGGRIVSDICWCTISEPVFPPGARVVLTNSGKYAHYGPGLSGRGLRFAGMQGCADAAVTGRAPDRPAWLA